MVVPLVEEEEEEWEATPGFALGVVVQEEDRNECNRILLLPCSEEVPEWEEVSMECLAVWEEECIPVWEEALVGGRRSEDENVSMTPFLKALSCP